jgi:hypothetical protein
VGTAGVLDLKAALYRQQQQAQQAQADPSAAAERKSRKTAGVDVSLLVRRNTGVEARDQRDREQIKVRLAHAWLHQEAHAAGSLLSAAWLVHLQHPCCMPGEAL